MNVEQVRAGAEMALAMARMAAESSREGLAWCSAVDRPEREVAMAAAYRWVERAEAALAVWAV